MLRGWRCLVSLELSNLFSGLLSCLVYCFPLSGELALEVFDLGGETTIQLWFLRRSRCRDVNLLVGFLRWSFKRGRGESVC